MQFATTRYGRPAVRRLREVLTSAKGADPLAPVTVIVPNNFVGVSTRRALASGEFGPITGTAPGLAGVAFLTVYRMAELLGSAALASQKRRPVSNPVLAAAMRRELSSAAGAFEPVKDHPTTERRLVQAHRELSNVTSAALDALSSQSKRAADVVGLHRRVTSRLAQDWYTEQDLVRAALDNLTSGDAVGSLLHDLGEMVLFLPQDMTPLQAELLAHLSDRTPLSVIVGLTGHADADASIHTTLERLGVTEQALSWPHVPQATRRAIPSVNLSDPDDEVRHVIREILAAARDGVRLDRMAVVYASDKPYARLLNDHLASADIPFNGARAAGLHESVAGRTLLRLLALIDRELARDDVIGLISSLPFRWQGRRTPSRRWDDISRRAGVVRGLPDWQSKLARLIADRDAELARLGDDPEYEWRVARLARERDSAAQLALFVEELHTDIARGLGATSWRERTNWAKRALRRYLGDQRDWPESEILATEKIQGILDRLSGLDQIEPDADGSVFHRTLETEMEGGLGRVGRFGDGVLVGRAWSTVGLTLDRIWVLGLSEGTFPSRPREDSLLPDRERAVANGLLPMRADRLGDEHRHLLATLAAVDTDDHIVLLRSRGDLRASTERPASRWLDDLVGDRPSIEVPSFAGGLVTSRFPATQQEYDLRSLVALGAQNHPLLADGTALARSADMQASRRSTDFTRFDGNLAGLDIPDPTAGRPISTTALETWARCPHHYFVRYLLGVYPLETPEQIMRLEPMQRGNLVHAVLEKAVVERIASAETHVGWTTADTDRLLQIAEAEFIEVQRIGLTGEPLYWRRDQILIKRDLEDFAKHDTERRHTDNLSPVAAELGFGIDGNDAVTITLPSGKGLRLRGSIDLVDRSAAGEIHIVDYKTGGPFTVDEENPHDNGKKLQLALYAQAARIRMNEPDTPVRSSYWFISRRGEFKQPGYDITPDVLDKVNGAVDTIVENIAAGRFPQHPTNSTRQAWIDCDYCDPDGLGVREARRTFERKANHPDLRAYIELADADLLLQQPIPDLEQ